MAEKGETEMNKGTIPDEKSLLNKIKKENPSYYKKNIEPLERPPIYQIIVSFVFLIIFFGFIFYYLMGIIGIIYGILFSIFAHIIIFGILHMQFKRSIHSYLINYYSTNKIKK